LIDIAAKTTARDVAAANKSFGMDLNVIGSLLWVVVGQRTGFLGFKTGRVASEGFRWSLEALRGSGKTVYPWRVGCQGGYERLLFGGITSLIAINTQ
jgi:hypothetical protein